MSNFMFILFSTIILIWGCSKDNKEQVKSQSDHQMKMSDNSMQHADKAMGVDSSMTEKIVYYTCPMQEHSHVHSSEPGKCPECNMDLVPVIKTTKEKAEFYGCTMAKDSQVRSDKPGNCPECGMPLQPIRLGKNKTMEM